MPKTLINKLTARPKLSDLQKHIALNKNIYALPKDSQLIYLPDLIKFFPWELPSAVFDDPFTKTDLTNFYITQLKAYHEIFQNLINANSPYLLIYHNRYTPLTEKHIKDLIEAYFYENTNCSDADFQLLLNHPNKVNLCDADARQLVTIHTYLAKHISAYINQSTRQINDVIQSNTKLAEGTRLTNYHIIYDFAGSGLNDVSNLTFTNFSLTKLYLLPFNSQASINNIGAYQNYIKNAIKQQTPSYLPYVINYFKLFKSDHIDAHEFNNYYDYNLMQYPFKPKPGQMVKLDAIIRIKKFDGTEYSNDTDDYLLDIKDKMLFKI